MESTDTNRVNVDDILRWIDENLHEEDAYSLWQAARQELKDSGEKSFVDFLKDSIDEAITIAENSLDEIETSETDEGN